MKFFRPSVSPWRNFFKAMCVVALFMALHAVASYLLHYTSFGDSLVLTCLTVAMVFCVLALYDIPLDIFLSLAFLSCFAGFWMGTEIPRRIVSSGVEPGIDIHVITTAGVTLVLGLVNIFISNSINRHKK